MTTAPAHGSWVSCYLGLPYLANGRVRSGIDCWGLVRLAIAEQAGIDVPDYGEVDAADLRSVARRMRSDSAAGPWMPVDPTTDRPFDVVLMLARSASVRVPAHCGLVTQPGHMLHIQKATLSVVVPYRHGASSRPDPHMVGRVVGVFRHEAIAR